MIQAIERAFSALGFLAGRRGREVALGEIADGLELNKATCAHIMKTLCELGAVEQAAARRGYRLGPTLFTLTGGGGYRPDLVAAAEEPMRRFAAETGETVLLAVLRGEKRFTLCQIAGTHDVQVRTEPTAEADVYSTATGRLLLAFASQCQREAFLAAAGLPGRRWPEAGSRRKLDSALEQIRADGHVVHHRPTHVVAIAQAVEQGGQVVSALGTFLPEYRFEGRHRRAVVEGIERAAHAVSHRLAERASQLVVSAASR